MTGCTTIPLLEDDRMRVTRVEFEPGGETGWHVHSMEYVVVTLTECRMRIELPGGEARHSVVPAGSSYRRPMGTEHNIINDGPAPMSFVEIELKPQG